MLGSFCDTPHFFSGRLRRSSAALESRREGVIPYPCCYLEARSLRHTGNGESNPQSLTNHGMKGTAYKTIVNKNSCAVCLFVVKYNV